MRGIGILPLLVACVSDNIIEKQDNVEPTILITSHSDGVEVEDGYVESFRATAADEDHDLDELSVIWYVGEEVACDWETVEPDGTSGCDIVFVEGDENVIVEVRDPTGAAGVDEVSVSVAPTEAPVVEILTPISSGSYYSDSLIQFSALVSDAEDDPENLVIIWSSSIEGELSLDTAADASGEISDFAYLQEGEHAIELLVEDSTGKISTEEVVIDVNGENNIPSCEIVEPLDDSAFVLGDMITFRATGDDPDISNNQLLVEWVSDKDGSLGSSTPTSAGEITFSFDDLSADSHTISLNVSDEIGAICTDQVLVHVGTLPIALIDQPLDGEVFSVGETIAFQGTATDQEDQPNELSVAWTSDIDGVLASGNVNSQNISEFSSDVLTAGLHSLSFRVTDTVGLMDEDSVSFRVNTPPVVDSLSISPDPLYSNNVLSFSITTSDADGDTVIETYAWYENGSLTSFTGTTISASELDVGETWTIRVTPTDPYIDGNYVEESITVSNTAPAITTPVISSSEGSNIYNDSVLSCSVTASDVDESVIESYIWNVNGNTYNGASLDLSITGAFPADSVECIASVSDSNGGSASSSTTQTIDNRAASVDSISFTPDPVYWNQDLSALAGYLDDDGDTVTGAYAWYEDGSLTSFTSDTISASELDAGEEWTVRITPNDGHENGSYLEASITIGNQAPSVSIVTITPNIEITTETELLCSGSGTDPEEGSLTPSYEWYVNANLLGSSDILQLDNSMVSPSDWVECVATVTDSQGESSFAVALAQVENTAPTVDSISLSPSSLSPLDTVTCAATASDIDGDTPSLSFVFNNLSTGATHSPTSSTASDATLDLSIIAINPNEELECVVTAMDAAGDQASDSVSTTMDWDIPTISVIASGLLYTGDILNCSGTASDYAGNDLSSQIQYQWINTSNGNSILSTSSTYTIDASQTDVGDILECIGTVTDSFGEVASDTHDNMVVNVTNSAPIFLNPPELSNYAPYHGDTVNCSATYSDLDDPNLSELQVDYQWVNASLADQVITTGTDSYTVDRNEIPIGDELQCIVILIDTQGFYATESSPIATINNALPVLSNLQITPNTGVFLDSLVSCSGTAFDAEDGDITPNISYEWRVGNIVHGGANPFIVDSNYLNIGDTLTCHAQVLDPSTQEAVTDTISVLIENRAPSTPTASISWSGTESAPTSNDDLTCLGSDSTDLDGQTVTYSYTWTSDAGGSVSGDTVLSSEILEGETWTCTVTATDGSLSADGTDSVLIQTDQECGLTDCDLGLDLGSGQILDFSLIPAGSDPLGRYDISQNFYLMTTEVTQGMFNQMMGYYAHTGQNFITGEGDNYATYYANWHMAVDFANQVTQEYNSINGTSLSACYSCSNSGTDSVSCSEAVSPLTCDGFRLPTSGEWEYAGRSGTVYDFWTVAGGGDYSSTNCTGTETIQDGASDPLIGLYAHYCGNNSPAGVKEVAGLESNLWGLYDMHGNIREWVADRNGCVFPESATDPLCSSGSDYILRGGTFTANGYGLSFTHQPSAYPEHFQENIGFRLALTE